MIHIRKEEEIENLRIAGNIVYKTHKYLKNYIKPGITTLELNDLSDKFIRKNGAIPSFKDYNGFPKSICTSINNEVVHGIPGEYVLKDGDILSIDIGACYNGYHGDSAWTYGVGIIDVEKEYLLRHTKESLYKGLEQIKPGNYISDISSAIENYAKKYNLGVVRELVGHGVGTKLHEEPDIPNYRTKAKDIKLEKGMVFAIEPMLNLGTHKIYICDDEWTIITRDGKPSAHYEHTVVVTDDGYEILTGE